MLIIVNILRGLLVVVVAHLHICLFHSYRVLLGERNRARRGRFVLEFLPWGNVHADCAQWVKHGSKSETFESVCICNCV